jgi:hypothetical protein
VMPTLLQFVLLLEHRRTEYGVLRFSGAIYIEVGRYAYKFNGDGKCVGGWIHGCKWPDDWEKWRRLLDAGALGREGP